jgi:hypothetical protein
MRLRNLLQRVLIDAPFVLHSRGKTKLILSPFLPRIWVNPGDPSRRRLGRVDVGVQMRRDVREHACCPRHNETFCVLSASPCALWQPVRPATAATLQLASLRRSAAVASLRAMAKKRGSETAENDGSKLVNVSHLRCQRSLPGRSCYPACRRRHPARGSRVYGIFAVFKRDQK